MSWNHCGDEQLAFTSMAMTAEPNRQVDLDSVVSLPTSTVDMHGVEHFDPLLQHSLSKILGTRDRVTLQRLKAAMQVQQCADRERGISSVVDVQTLDGEVLWDWDRYIIARELGMDVRVARFEGSDPVGYLCAQGLHERHIGQSVKALIVVSMCRWAPRGRPRKSTHTVDFADDVFANRTLEVMAKMAGVGTTSISQAKVLYSFGLADQILAGDLRFHDAYRRARKVRETGFENAVEAGEISFEDAYQQAMLSAPTQKRELLGNTTSAQGLLTQVRELERCNENLRREVQYLETENARLKSQLAKSKPQF